VAHVLANLLAHETGIAVSGETVEKGPEDFPGAHAHLQELKAEFLDRGEVPHKGKAGPQRY